jgi:uncharacterized membrane protein
MKNIKWENIIVMVLATLYIINRLTINGDLNIMSMLDVLAIIMILSMARYIIRELRKGHIIKNIVFIFKD